MTNKTTSKFYNYRGSTVDVAHITLQSYGRYILRYLTITVNRYREYTDAKDFWRKK